MSAINDISNLYSGDHMDLDIRTDYACYNWEFNILSRCRVISLSYGRGYGQIEAMIRAYIALMIKYKRL